MLLSLLTLASYWNVWQFDFINFDDPVYITENPTVQTGLSLENISWAFTTFEGSLYQPITWISLMLDTQLFGVNAGMYHFMNLLLHIINALLWFHVLRRMTGAYWAPAFVAIAFALHPMSVESVAWITERKNTLSMFFFLLLLESYVTYCRRPHKLRYSIMTLFFILGLLTKAMLVTAPILLMLLDYWPLERYGTEKNHGFMKKSKQLFIEKLPLFFSSAIISILTLLAAKSGGALQPFEKFSLLTRLCNTFYAYCIYIKNLLWPLDLSIIYPHPGNDISVTTSLFAFTMIILISLPAFRYLKSYPFFAVGWLWYLVALVPNIGLIQAGDQPYADRFTYLAYIGLFVVLLWFIREKATSLKKPILVAGAVVMVFMMTLMSYFQVRHWRNDISVFRQAVKVHPHNSIAHLNLGAAYHKQGRWNLAARHSAKVIELKPELVAGYNNLGYLLSKQSNLDSAKTLFYRAMSLDSLDKAVHNNLGELYFKQGKLDSAFKHFKIAVRIDPNFERAKNNLAYMEPLMNDNGEANTR